MANSGTWLWRFSQVDLIALMLPGRGRLGRRLLPFFCARWHRSAVHQEISAVRSFASSCRSDARKRASAIVRFWSDFRSMQDSVPLAFGSHLGL